MKKLKLTFAFLAIFFIFNSAVLAQKQEADLPDTVLGNIVREWLAIVESGKPNEIERFVASRFSAAARKNQPNAAAYFRKLHEQSGGLQILSVTPPAGENPMYLTVKAKRGNYFASVIIGRDRAESDRLAGIGVTRADDPGRERLSANGKALSEAEIIAVVRQEVGRRAADRRFSGVVLIARDDEILFHRAYGFADREIKRANAFETKFHLASVGKIFTATAIAQLVNAGKLSFDDPVGRILPDFPNEEVKRVTIHQLLTHSAGMGSFFESPGLERGRVYRTATEEISVYKDEKLFFAPGSAWRYSNAGYSLLGAIVERVTGKTYLQYVRENIFAPLGMKDKADDEKPGKDSLHAVLYRQSEDDPLGLEAFRPVGNLTDGTATGFGGGYLSAESLFRFARAFSSEKLLGAETTRLMLEPKIKRSPTTEQGYAMILRTSNGQKTFGHSGGGRAAVQVIKSRRKLVFPVDSGMTDDVEIADYTIIVLTNTAPPSADSLAAEIVDFLTNQLALPKEVKLKKK
jgi:CubicO group peptidase (beta-lactamase class C family)